MNKTNYILVVIAALVVGGVSVLGLFYPKQIQITIPVPSAIGSSVGSTFNTAKVASIVVNPVTATSTSILNTDASDRIVTNGFASCSGLGVSSGYTGAGFKFFQVLAATTSTATPSSVTNINLPMYIDIATSSPTDAYTATSTYNRAFVQRWASGSYMTFQFNATNTASCVVGVGYLSS